MAGSGVSKIMVFAADNTNDNVENLRYHFTTLRPALYPFQAQKILMFLSGRQFCTRKFLCEEDKMGLRSRGIYRQPFLLACAALPVCRNAFAQSTKSLFTKAIRVQNSNTYNNK